MGTEPAYASPKAERLARYLQAETDRSTDADGDGNVDVGGTGAGVTVAAAAGSSVGGPAGAPHPATASRQTAATYRYTVARRPGRA